MRKKHILKSMLALVFALVLMTAEIAPACAITWSDVNDLKSDASALNSQKKELQNKLKALADDKSKVLEKRKLLDQQIGTLVSQISNAEQQIAGYDVLIQQTEAELIEAEEQEAAQYDLFCRRVRAMEKNGSKLSYWSVLFKATSFTDFMTRINDTNEIMEADQQVIDELRQLQEDIAEKKANLQTARTETVNLKSSLSTQKAELDKQRREANALAAEIESNAEEYQKTLDEIDAEEEAIQKKIVQMSQQLAAQNSSSGSASNAALGGYIWPVPSRKINSPFGNRNTGIAGASKNHKGVDIGGVYYSTQVHAAKAGTVIVSQYSKSYGNYVVISHGSGNTTLYAHMSSRSVSEGQYVEQNAIIGVTGSTGISSGPHLHFEITENGVRVDPLKYLTGYVKNW